ncbi:hypothetical protein F8388_020345 [Cannabis sativa]|uniref:Aminotransferase-like plant mobile domain-containing protein n=1 Tax=Cannabis sativa TaxID=3483 RepID=A0A7J6HJ91_CANSA|nr:hypothetical protein F8388_020345 [Cannabis sativa]
MTVSSTVESAVSSECDDAPPSRDELFPIIYEKDRVYLYQDSMRDHIISGQNLPLRCHYEGNDFEIDYRSLSGAINGWKERSISVSTRFQALLKSVGILSSMWVCSGIEIFRDVTILNQLVSFWCPTTHTILVNWDEFSITLEDVYALPLLPICSITSAIEPVSKDERDLLSALTEASNDLKKNDATCDMHEWITHFHRGNGYSLVELAACITLWLSRKQLQIRAFYLGTLYHNLDSIVRDINSGSMKTISVVDATFLQLFIWESFHKLAPPRKCLKDGSSRAWSVFRSRLKGSVQLTDIVDYFRIQLPPISYQHRCLFHLGHAGSLEKASKSCLLGSLQVSKRSYDLFQLPCKERQGGVSSKFVTCGCAKITYGQSVKVLQKERILPLKLRHTHKKHSLWTLLDMAWLVSVIFLLGLYRMIRNTASQETQLVDPLGHGLVGAHITSQETQLVDPPGHGLVGERHFPSRSISDDMMSAFLEGDQSVLGDVCWGSNLSEKGAETHTNHSQNAHKACPSAPTDNPLVIEHIQVESEYGIDLAALVGLDSECLAPLGPYTSRFCSLHTSLDKEFTSFFENLSSIKKSLFIQLSSPSLPLLRLTFEISEQHYSHLLEYWKMLCLIFSERPSMLGKIVEFYFEVVNSSIRYRHLVGELEKMGEERDIKVREVEELNHKIAGMKQRCKDQGSPSNTWVYTPP